MIVPEPTTFRLRCRHANHHTTNTVKFGCLSLNVNVVGSKTIHNVLQPYYIGCYQRSAHGLLPITGIYPSTFTDVHFLEEDCVSMWRVIGK